MEDSGGLWRFALIALVAVMAGALVGILLGGANSDPFETVVRTAAGKQLTVTETVTETETAVKTKTVTATEELANPAGGTSGTNDDADKDSCSDSYAPVCLEPFDGYRTLTCSEVRRKDFSSIGEDPYALDPDGNGVACES